MKIYRKTLDFEEKTTFFAKKVNFFKKYVDKRESVWYYKRALNESAKIELRSLKTEQETSIQKNN